MSDFVILNGFDRSGTSAISRLLGMHPRIELIMQPFNSGFIREKMYQILDENNQESKEHQFFADLSKNILNNDLIRSHWHQKYSSTGVYKKDHLHIIKTTINHFTQKWMVENYPEIEVWGIWREPKDILESIVRNEVYDKWYPKAIHEIAPTVLSEESLRPLFQPYVSGLNSRVKEIAFLIAVRSYFFFLHLTSGKIINYEEFKLDPNYLHVFLKTYELEMIDFSESAKTDLNIFGQYAKPEKDLVYNQEEQQFIDRIFEPLKLLMNQRHNIS